ncbi:unnamed protein product [Moneuplotes crassus]|uniref:Uncharacterized protein n=1 Tax=Euplotes crassus TaxID=5936 RepID=A0AAD1U7P9_EUPCR|nr:unnamed protein product [Moneuplotes crassus]
MTTFREKEREESLNQILKEKIQILQEKYDRLLDLTDHYEETRELEIENSRYCLENTSLKNQLLKYQQMNSDLEQQKSHLMKVLKSHEKFCGQQEFTESQLKISKQEIVQTKPKSRHTFVRYFDSPPDSLESDSYEKTNVVKEVEIQKTLQSPRKKNTNQESLLKYQLTKLESEKIMFETQKKSLLENEQLIAKNKSLEEFNHFLKSQIQAEEMLIEELSQKLSTCSDSTSGSSQMRYDGKSCDHSGFHDGAPQGDAITDEDSSDLLNNSDYKNPFNSYESQMDENEKLEKLTTDSFFNDREPLTGKHFDMKESFQDELERLGFNRDAMDTSNDYYQCHSQESYQSEADESLLQDVEQRIAVLLDGKNMQIEQNNSQTLLEDLREVNYSCDSHQNYEYFDLSQLSKSDGEDVIGEEDESEVHHLFSKLKPTEILGQCNSSKANDVSQSVSSILFPAPKSIGEAFYQQNCFLRPCISPFYS